MNHKIIIILLLFLFSYSLFANDKKYQDIQIKFSKTNLTVKQALDELTALPEINIVYKGNETFIDFMLMLPMETISVKEALAIIEKQAPVDIVFNNNHIIVKTRKLNKSYELKGSVKDTETLETLIGATVLMPETSKGTVTNVNGEFFLQLAPGSYQFEISYLGYQDKYIDVNLYNEQTLQIFLEETQQEIQEVRVIGNHYEIQELETGRNIERIDAKTIKQINYNNPTDALQGRINGVWVTRVSGAPGDHQKIRIRGINSLFAAVDPLYVVNGVQIPIVNLNSLGISDINSHDIESITVLKDVASTAYYGYQGGNGVVKIETKKGGGKNQINFSSRTGFQYMKKRYPLMNTKELLQTIVKIDTVFPDRILNYPRYFTYSIDGDDNVSIIPVDRFVYPYPYDSTEYLSDEWQGELFQTGLVQEYQLAFSGSKKKINYFISGNYYNHKGVVILSNYNKYNYNINLATSPFKNFMVDFSGFGSFQKNENNLDNYFGNKCVLQGINIEPNYNSLTRFEKSRRRKYPVSRDETKDLYDMYRPQEMYAFRYRDIPNLYIDNLPDGRDFFFMKGHTLDILSNNSSLEFRYKIHPDVSINNRFSLMFKEYKYESIIKADSINNVYKQYNSNENYRTLCDNLDINYSKNINSHDFRLNASYRIYRDQVQWKVDSIYGFDLDEIDRTNEIYLKGSNALYGKSGNIVRDIRSLIFHAKYSYINKYTVSVFMNFDHLEEGNFISSKALFPSVALNWDVSKEFVFSTLKTLDELSLYLNWGRVGNYPLNSLSNDLNDEIKMSYNHGYEEGKYIYNLANHGLKHEEAEEINYGLRTSVFQKRLSANINYFIRENRDLIFNRVIPYYYGGGFVMKNIGNMSHKGIELSIDAYPIETDKYSWNMVIGYSHDKQYVTGIYRDHDTLNFFTSDILIPEFYIGKDAPLGDILGYKYEGYWTDKDSLLQDPDYINHNGIKYYKYDTTSIELTQEDKIVIGNSLPDFTCHWINKFRFHNFIISMHWYAVVGVDKFNATRASTYFTLLNKEIKTYTDEGSSHFMDPEFYESSYFVEDASFARLKSLSVIYSPRQPIWRNIKASFSLNFENMVTLSRYKGYDPEATIYTNNNFSNNAIDLGAYPAPKSIFLGIDFTF